MAVTAQDVADYLGQGDDSNLVALAGEHLPLIRAMIHAYTRGVGFGEDPEDDYEAPIAAVLTSATARSASNPTSVVTVSIDDASFRRTVFDGFTLLERLILDGYRRKAA